jgi:ferredoxin
MQQPVRHGAARLHIDWTACDARGLCTELLPELLGRDEWGYPVPRGGPDPAVPAELVDVARFAVTHCPKLALRLLDDKG